MTRSRLAGIAPVFALGAMLAGCQGVTSTPAPPPAPPPAYQTLSDLVAQGGDRSFETGGVKYNSSAAGFANAVSQPFGAGVKVDYQASSGNYTLTAPNNDTSVFNDPGDVVSSDAAGNISFASGNGTLSLAVPQVDGVPLSYTLLGTWEQSVGGESSTVRLAVGGIPTLASDMPVSGSATYQMEVGGTAYGAGGYSVGLTGSGASGTFTADFAGGTVSTTMDLAGTDTVNGNGAFDFGTLTGTGTIASGGPGFSGTLSQTGGSGVFSGAFFGPQAAEMGYAWEFEGANFDAAGLNAGKKN